MSVGPNESAPVPAGLPALPFFYGWVIVVMSALAMLATFPGRSHGLGTITERLVDDPGFLKHRDLFAGLPLLTGPELLRDAQVSKDEGWQQDLKEFKKRMRDRFGELNLWATLLGALFCIPCGKLLDRFGARVNLTLVTASLGLVCVAMRALNDYWTFFFALLLTRGLGQSALSVISLAMPGKWFSRRLGLAMGIYTILMALGFISAFSAIGAFKSTDWRTVWSAIGYILLLGVAPLSWLLVRNTPEEVGLRVDGAILPDDAPVLPATGHSLGAALVEPAFWAFALATSMYGLVSSGVLLFNQDILRQRGFNEEDYYSLLKVSTGLGLAGNFLGGFLVQRMTLKGVMALSMTLLAGALFWMPQTSTFRDLIGYAVGMSLGGGMMTVVFFTAFGKVFGRLHLGQIQGIAQMLTVFASALGQKLVPHCNRLFDSYMPFFYASGCVVVALGVWTVALRMPATVAVEGEPVG
jgi:MFS family permease